MRKIFIGIGSGAVQLGLWSYYAFKAEMDVVLVEVDSKKVDAIRRNKNCYWINIAYLNKISFEKIGPVRIYNPKVEKEKDIILSCIEKASEITTAVPDVFLYKTGGISDLLKKGLKKRKKDNPLVIYASENRIQAARILEKLVFPKKTPSHIYFSDTVIERMGGVHFKQSFIKKLKLKTITLDSREALLVEDFDRIIIEENSMKTCFKRFIKTGNIHIYEEQKLYGHNAVHFLLGVLAKLKGYTYMSEYSGDKDFKYIGIDALIEETGGWFKKRYKSSGEKIAQDKNYNTWAKKLCRRIINPFLYDTVERVIRDLERKLAWDNRIIGTMQNAIASGIVPKRYALGVAGALNLLFKGKDINIDEKIKKIWNNTGKADKKTTDKIVDLVSQAYQIILTWNRKTSLYEYILQKNYLKS